MLFSEPEPHVDLSGFHHSRPGAAQFNSAMGMPTARSIWEGVLHGRVAYALYMQDRLRDAVKTIERALLQSPGGGWLPQLLYLTSGELEARDHARRVERPPFIFEVPADVPAGDALVAVIEEHARRVERFLDTERLPTMFTLLPEGSLAESSTSPHGYMAPKMPCYKICLPHSSRERVEDLGGPVIHEYAHVAEAELSQGNAPHWVREGLAEWAESELTGDEEAVELALAPGELPRLGEIEGLFSSDRSVDDEEVEYAYAGALSAMSHLIAKYGRFGVREFLVRLRTESEGRAFKNAFGESLRAFERDWHERLKQQSAE